MKTKFFILLNLVMLCHLLHGGVSIAMDSDTWNPATTHIVLIGMLKWKDPDYDDFPTKNRKDIELYNSLRRHGVPASQIVYLKDQSATLKTMRETIKTSLKNTPAGSDFIFYYAGHGTRDDNDVAYLANYDIVSEKESKTGFHIMELVKLVENNFHGNRILLLGDFCYSGELAVVAEKLSKKGFKVASLTSSTASSESTGNWTFTQTLVDAFAGASLFDHDRDNAITLHEIQNEVFNAMKFRESQLPEFIAYGFPESFTMVKTEPTHPAWNRIGGYVLADRGDGFEAARVIAHYANSTLVQFYDYSDKSNEWMTPESLREFKFRTYPKGAKVRVKWEGDYYDATVLEVKDGFHFVSYDDYEESWNEWVMSDRIKTI